MTLPTTMKAIIIRDCGGPDVFETVEIERPRASEGEVVIEVRATSVNPVDWKMRNGFGRFLIGAFPAILHPDCAGVVVELGSRVDDFAIGDRVYSFATGLMEKPGALAQYMAADARMVAKAPTSLSFEEAASLPLVWSTACFALLDRTGIEPGSTLLIQGGTGGVGSVAVQLAKARLDVKLFATCGSEERCRIAEELGADRAFDYTLLTPQDMAAEATGGHGFDVIFNTVGDAAIDASVSAGGFGTRIIDINGTFPTPPNAFQFNQMTLHGVFAGHPITHGVHQEKIGEFLRELTTLIEAGRVRPLLDQRRFTFADIGQAHDYQENGRPIGKVVVTAEW